MIGAMVLQRRDARASPLPLPPPDVGDALTCPLPKAVGDSHRFGRTWIGQGCEEAGRVPWGFFRSWPCLALLGLACLPHDTWPQRPESCASIVPHLYAKALRRVHLLLEKLDEAAPCRRHDLRDEDQPHAASLPVGLCTLPQGRWGCRWAKKSGQLLSWVKMARTALYVALCIEMVHRPLHHCLRRVIEPLPHDLTADTSSAAACDFDKRGDGILIQAEMIDSPASPTALFPRHPSLTRDEQPTPWLDWINLATCEQAGIVRQQGLKQSFGVACSRSSTSWPLLWMRQMPRLTAVVSFSL
jgi:hypothetical protein